ncbi:hypothetical protein OG379_38575 [Streptomyces sp. NBC_01166]|uniref:hypothetical protein n=1 Tax=Streptomyces sp. NBC_01166 TaxID=2903755 RepID=UPI00386C6196|nr:hypothetical protein OG379_38575 [Streptomyces sp. NBC_01166]
MGKMAGDCPDTVAEYEVTPWQRSSASVRLAGARLRRRVRVRTPAPPLHPLGPVQQLFSVREPGPAQELDDVGIVQRESGGLATDGDPSA